MPPPTHNQQVIRSFLTSQFGNIPVHLWFKNSDKLFIVCLKSIDALKRKRRKSVKEEDV